VADVGLREHGSGLAWGVEVRVHLALADQGGEDAARFSAV